MQLALGRINVKEDGKVKEEYMQIIVEIYSRGQLIPGMCFQLHDLVYIKKRKKDSISY